MKRFISLFIAALALVACKEKILEDRQACLQIELFATVAEDGHVDVDLSIPAGSNTEKYRLEMDVDGNPVEDWYRAEDGNQPKRITIPDSRVLHFVIPKTTAGEHVLHARLFSDSFSAEAETEFAMDNLAISAEALSSDSGYEVSVYLERGRTEITYAIDVSMDGAPFKDITWKRPGFDPKAFRFDEERRVIFSIPRQDVGEHSMAVKVSSGYLSATAALLLKESSELEATLDVVPTATQDYTIDITLVKGRPDVDYSMSVTYDGKPLDGLRTTGGQTVNYKAFRFGEDGHLRLVLPAPSIGTHTVSVNLTDGRDEVALSRTFSRTNELSVIVDGDVTYRDERIWWNVLLVNGDTGSDYSATVTLDGRPLEVRGEGFQLSSFRFPSGRTVTMSAPLPDYEQHTLAVTVTDGVGECTTEKTFRIINDLKGKLVVYYALPGYNRDASESEGYYFDFVYDDGVADLSYDLTLAVDGRTYSDNTFNSTGVDIRRVKEYFVNKQGKGTHHYVLTASSQGRSWSFETDLREEHLALEILSGGNILWTTSNASFTRTIEYSKDAGRTWTKAEAAASGRAISANIGDFVLVRGDNEEYARNGNNTAEIKQMQHCYFGSDALTFALSGDMDALLKERSGALSFRALAGVFNSRGLRNNTSGRRVTLPDRPLGPYCFQYLFAGAPVSSSPVELPWTELAEGCYYGMYQGSSLGGAPELKATVMKAYCYASMFKGTQLYDTGKLPSTSLADYCYKDMFADCQRLERVIGLPATTMAAGCYSGMFSGCKALKEAPALPSTSLAAGCYSSMFYDCSALTSAPALPATTLAPGCYQYMFWYCKKLTSAPALPATTLAEDCYNSMFQGSGLTNAPTLPATMLARGCYSSMFASCSNLTNAPALPATTLAGNCYSNMFANCSNLTNAPALPATTLAGSCYSNMFANCGNLTIAPALPATVLEESCYENMFRESGLTNAPALPATTMKKACYKNMFRATKITSAPALPATTLAPECYRGMFFWCSNLTSAPALPATTLTESCYQQMFSLCNNLSSSPVLPAATLVKDCYTEMFRQCSRLNTVTALFSSLTDSKCTQDWLVSVPATGTFYMAESATCTVTGDSGIPSGWTRKIYK